MMPSKNQPVTPDLSATEEDLEKQAAAYLEAGGRQLALRNTVYLPLLTRKEYGRAKAISDALIAFDPKDALAWRDRASLLVRRGNAEDAASAMDHCLTASGKVPNSEILSQGIQVYLAAGQLTKAVALAIQGAPRWPQDSRLCKLAVIALHRASPSLGTGDQAQSAAEVLLDLAQDEPTPETRFDLALTAAPALAARGRSHMLYQALLSIGASTSEDARVLFEIGRASHLSNPAAPEAEDFLSRCLEADPTHKQARDLLARVAFSQGLSAKAVELLEAVPENERSTALLLQLARAHLANKSPDKAVSIYEKLTHADPENLTLVRQHIGALMQAGEEDAAATLHAANLKLRREKLSGGLQKNIEALYANPPQDAVPQHRLDWIYNTLSSAGKAPADRQEFENQINIANAVDHLLLEYAECHPNAQEEMRFLRGDTAAAEAELRAGLAAGNGAFIATAHIGLLFGGPMVMEQLGIDSVWLASVPKLGSPELTKNLISTTMSDDAAIGRSVVRALKKGAVVTIAIDGSANRQNTAYPFFDREIKLSDFLPRLAFRLGVPSFFPHLPLNGMKIAPQVTRLPDPTPGESVDEFVDRWMNAFLAKLEATFYQAPETLRGSGGFWTNITS